MLRIDISSMGNLVWLPQTIQKSFSEVSNVEKRILLNGPNLKYFHDEKRWDHLWAGFSTWGPLKKTGFNGSNLFHGLGFDAILGDIDIANPACKIVVSKVFLLWKFLMLQTTQK